MSSSCSWKAWSAWSCLHRRRKMCWQVKLQFWQLAASPIGETLLSEVEQASQAFLDGKDWLAYSWFVLTDYSNNLPRCPAKGKGLDFSVPHIIWWWCWENFSLATFSDRAIWGRLEWESGQGCGILASLDGWRSTSGKCMSARVRIG